MTHLNLDNDNIFEHSAREHEYRMRLYNNKIIFHGVDVGGKMSIKYTQDNIIIIHVGGHSGWCGLGTSQYYPPNYRIGIIDLDKNTFNQYHEIEYTRSHMKEAWLIAQLLACELSKL